MINLTSPLPGTAQTNLTSPTYTFALDQALDVNSKQWYVTALGGTQTNVRIHSASDPFTLSFWRDKVIKTLGQLGLNGQYGKVEVNRYKQITRKGVLIAANQPPRPMIVRTEIEIPAGAETFDKVNVQAALSAHFGGSSQQSAGWGDTTGAGSL